MSAGGRLVVVHPLGPAAGIVIIGVVVVATPTLKPDHGVRRVVIVKQVGLLGVVVVVRVVAAWRYLSNGGLRHCLK